MENSFDRPKTQEVEPQSSIGALLRNAIEPADQCCRELPTREDKPTSGKDHLPGLLISDKSQLVNGDIDKASYDKAMDDFLKLDKPKMNDKELAESADKILHYINKSGSFGNDFQREQIVDEFEKATQSHSAKELADRVNSELAKAGSPLRISASEKPIIAQTTPGRIEQVDTGALTVDRRREVPPTVQFRRDCAITLNDTTSKYPQDAATYSITSETYQGKFGAGLIDWRSRFKMEQR